MSQTITVKVKLLLTKEQEEILNEMSHTYISVINQLVSEMVDNKKSTKRLQNMSQHFFRGQLKIKRSEIRKVYFLKE